MRFSSRFPFKTSQQGSPQAKTHTHTHAQLQEPLTTSWPRRVSGARQWPWPRHGSMSTTRQICTLRLCGSSTGDPPQAIGSCWFMTFLSFWLYGCGSKPCTPGEHQNRWQMDVHPPQNGAIGSAPWPYSGYLSHSTLGVSGWKSLDGVPLASNLYEPLVRSEFGHRCREAKRHKAMVFFERTPAKGWVSPKKQPKHGYPQRKTHPLLIIFGERDTATLRGRSRLRNPISSSFANGIYATHLIPLIP